MYLMPLHCRLKIIKILNFVMCILLQKTNKKRVQDWLMIITHHKSFQMKVKFYREFQRVHRSSRDQR